nr:hypothetical protein [Streptomyces sp. MJM1172]
MLRRYGWSWRQPADLGQITRAGKRKLQLMQIQNRPHLIDGRLTSTSLITDD